MQRSGWHPTCTRGKYRCGKCMLHTLHYNRTPFPDISEIRLDKCWNHIFNAAVYTSCTTYNIYHQYTYSTSIGLLSDYTGWWLAYDFYGQVYSFVTGKRMRLKTEREIMRIKLGSQSTSSIHYWLYICVISLQAVEYSAKIKSHKFLPFYIRFSLLWFLYPSNQTSLY